MNLVPKLKLKGKKIESIEKFKKGEKENNYEDEEKENIKKEDSQKEKMNRKETNWMEVLMENRKKIENNARKKVENLLKKETPKKQSIGSKVYSQKKKVKESGNKGEFKLTKSLKLDKEKVTPRKKKNTTINMMFEKMKKETKTERKENKIKEIINRFEKNSAQVIVGGSSLLKPLKNDERNPVTKYEKVLVCKESKKIEYDSRTIKSQKGEIKDVNGSVKEINLTTNNTRDTTKVDGKRDSILYTGKRKERK